MIKAPAYQEYHQVVHDLIGEAIAISKSVGAGLRAETYACAFHNRLASKYAKVERNHRVELWDDKDVIGAEHLDLRVEDVGVVILDDVLNRNEVISLDASPEDRAGPREKVEPILFKYTSILAHTTDLSCILLLDMRRPKVVWRPWWKVLQANKA